MPAAYPHLSTCAMFPLFSLRVSLRVWQSNYCEAEFTRCARYQRALAGKPSPMNLLPNGQTLELPRKGPA